MATSFHSPFQDLIAPKTPKVVTLGPLKFKFFLPKKKTTGNKFMLITVAAQTPATLEAQRHGNWPINIGQMG